MRSARSLMQSRMVKMTPKLTIDERLLGAARGIGPLIREHAEAAECKRRPNGAVLDALTATGLQRMYLPRALGGLEVDPITYARVAEEVSSFDSAAGWALQAGNQIAWWSARLSDQGIDEIYGDRPDVLIAGAFHPPQPVTQVDGGYRITGRAPLASNIHDADWLLLTGLVMDGERPRMADGAPEILQLIIRADEAKIVDTWHSLGMRGTDSNNVAVDDVFVPASRTFPLVPEFEPGPRYQGPLYRFPGVGELATIFTPVMLAVGRGAINELRGLAVSKTSLGLASTLRDRPVVQAKLAEAEAILRAARALFYNTICEAWERTLAGEPSTLEQKAVLMLAGTHAANSVSTVAYMMHGLAGTAGIYSSNRIERHFRDAQTLRHHGFLCAARYGTVGEIMLGLPPEFPLVRF
jgi:indole-3-acetate monooxygenase